MTLSLLATESEEKSGGNFFANPTFRGALSPFQETPIISGSSDFLAEEIDKPDHIEKFLERGLGRSLFSKRFSPSYFFEHLFVSIKILLRRIPRTITSRLQ